MSESSYHYGLTVSAFLGGISFTIMAFLIEMQVNNEFRYPLIDDMLYFMALSELVIVGLAASGIFFIVSSIGMIPVASGRIDDMTLMARCSYACMLVGFYILCGVIVLILLPFTFIGAITVAIIASAVIILYHLSYGREQ